MDPQVENIKDESLQSDSGGIQESLALGLHYNAANSRAL